MYCIGCNLYMPPDMYMFLYVVLAVQEILGQVKEAHRMYHSTIYIIEDSW